MYRFMTEEHENKLFPSGMLLKAEKGFERKLGYKNSDQNKLWTLPNYLRQLNWWKPQNCLRSNFVPAHPPPGTHTLVHINGAYLGNTASKQPGRVYLFQSQYHIWDGNISSIGCNNLTGLYDVIMDFIPTLSWSLLCSEGAILWYLIMEPITL